MLRSSHCFGITTCSIWRQSLRSLATKQTISAVEHHEELSPDAEPETQVVKPRKKREPKKSTADPLEDVPPDSLLAKQIRLEQSFKRRTAWMKGRQAKLEREQEASVTLAQVEVEAIETTQTSKLIAPRLAVQSSKHHHDLDSFLAYADRTKLKSTTTVYKGTHFEYTVAAALKTFDMSLNRTGRSNDLGIDLLGHWLLPDKREMNVLVQCKATKPSPAMVRELEGAYMGAPAGWQGAGVLALLVSTREASKGVMEGVQRSKSPIGIVQVTRDGDVKQFLWNAVASDNGLVGMGVTVRYRDGDGDDSVAKDGDSEGQTVRDEQRVSGNIALTWLGSPWRP